MSVRKRKLAKGKSCWQFDYRDNAGKRRSKHFPTRTEAAAYETKVRAELAARTHIPNSTSIIVDAACDLWLAHGESEGLEAGTLRQYRQHVKHHITPLIGATKLCDLTTPAVEAFKDRLLQDRSRPMTRAVLTSLKGVIKEAQRRGLVGHNPALPVSVRESKRDKEEVLIPSKPEIKAILDKSAELWPQKKIETSRTGEKKYIAVPWRPFIVTAVFTGLRCSELRGLTWSCVDLENRVIRVRQRADFLNRMGPPKSAAGKRDVPLAPMVVNTLRSWRLVCPRLENDIVFPTENGTIHSNSNIHKQCWGPLLRQLGFTEEATAGERSATLFTFHSLRHVAASLFIEQGWSPKKVQAVMGHSSIQVTFDTYGHLWKTTEGDADAMAQIEARLLA